MISFVSCPMALRGNTPSGQTFFYGIQPNATFRGISLAHRIPFWATMHPMGLTKGKTQSDDQWPYGGTPLRASPKFSFLPFLLPLPIIFSPPAFSKPLEFQIGLRYCSEHLTNFDIRSSGDFSAGKPHVSVGGWTPKVNILMPKFNNLKCP